jgi:hypothetical protein
LMTSRQTEPELLWVSKCVTGTNTAKVEEGCVQLVDVGVEYAVYEADARALVRVLIR